jgi:hypothetical protein
MDRPYKEHKLSELLLLVKKQCCSSLSQVLAFCATVPLQGIKGGQLPSGDGGVWPTRKVRRKVWVASFLAMRRNRFPGAF